MEDFPRTMVGGVSMPRLLVGSNWFLGYSHTSLAKDHFIKEYQTRENIARILAVFLQNNVDAVMGPPSMLLEEAIRDAEDAAGKAITRIITPSFNITANGEPDKEPEMVFDFCKNELNATFCMPHQCNTDALLDRMTGKIRDLGKYTRLIRERGMIPGLSTHMPESVVYADNNNEDVETYIQIYNAAGFMMQVEVDWVQRIIQNAKKPVMTIKPMAAGRLIPLVGMGFVWGTIRPQDMVTVGCTTPDEAREIVDLSFQLLNHQGIDMELQKTRSKNSLR